MVLQVLIMCFTIEIHVIRVSSILKCLQKTTELVSRPDPEVMWLDLRLVSPKVELEVLVRSQWAVLWGILFEQPQLLSLTSVPSSNDLVQKLHLQIRPKGVS